MKLKHHQFKRTIFATLFLIMNATFSFNANAQKVSDFIFDTYLIKEGMSQSTSMSIYQDKVGYIWVGTQAGVDRFDGYTFKQYAHDLKMIKHVQQAGCLILLKTRKVIFGL